MANFISLWDLVQNVQLTNEQDAIRWKWTAHGEYTTKSAYNIQFTGSLSPFGSSSIWKAEAEGKHKFFAWLLVQSKLLTADNLNKRHWPCDPVCSLCSQEQETAEHLILHCCFAKEVWQLMSTWSQGLVQQPRAGLSIAEWWQQELAGLPKKLRRTKAATMMYAEWNIWKERNRCIFEHKSTDAVSVLQEAKTEIAVRKLACGGPVIPVLS